MSVKSIFTYALAAVRKRIIRETAPTQVDGIPLVLFDQAADDFSVMLRDDIKARLNGRFERGLEMAKAGKVSAWPGGPQPDNHRHFKVLSSNTSSPPYSYRVDMDAETLRLPGFHTRAITASTSSLLISAMRRSG